MLERNISVDNKMYKMFFFIKMDSRNSEDFKDIVGEFRKDIAEAFWQKNACLIEGWKDFGKRS